MAMSLFSNADPLFGSLARMAEPIWGTLPSSALTMPRLSHPMDVIEHPTHIRIVADAPGMTPDDISVEITDNMLVLSGQKSQKYEDTKKQAGARTHIQERSFQSFTRSFPLPDNVQTDGITARMENGVLTVDVPKAPGQTKKATRIQVAAGTPGMMGGGMGGTTPGMMGGTGGTTPGMMGGTTEGMGGGMGGTTPGMAGGTTPGMTEGMGGGMGGTTTTTEGMTGVGGGTAGTETTNMPGSAGAGI